MYAYPLCLKALQHWLFLVVGLIAFEWGARFVCGDGKFGQPILLLPYLFYKF
jgi:hypothetical protein